MFVIVDSFFGNNNNYKEDFCSPVVNYTGPKYNGISTKDLLLPKPLSRFGPCPSRTTLASKSRETCRETRSLWSRTLPSSVLRIGEEGFWLKKKNLGGLVPSF